MSKAEEAAWKKYPYKNGMKGIICENSRNIFIEGYEQAEKDMQFIPAEEAYTKGFSDGVKQRLTIDDIELLHTFLYAVKNNKQGCFTFTRLTDEQYAEVLKRYLEAKQ